MKFRQLKLPFGRTIEDPEEVYEIFKGMGFYCCTSKLEGMKDIKRLIQKYTIYICNDMQRYYLLEEIEKCVKIVSEDKLPLIACRWSTGLNYDRQWRE